MKPGPLNLPTIWRGCDWQDIIFRWKTPDGEPFDLSLWIPVAQTRTGVSLNAVVTNADAGITKLSLPRATTAAMKLGQEQWDWVWAYIGPPSVVYPPILSGNVIVAQPDTRTIPVQPPT